MDKIGQVAKALADKHTLAGWELLTPEKKRAFEQEAGGYAQTFRFSEINSLDERIIELENELAKYKQFDCYRHKLKQVYEELDNVWRMTDTKAGVEQLMNDIEEFFKGNS